MHLAVKAKRYALDDIIKNINRANARCFTDGHKEVVKIYADSSNQTQFRPGFIAENLQGQKVNVCDS